MKHFKLSEFICPCCGKVHMDAEFLTMIDNAREISGVSYNIISGYRCPVHNADVGSTSTNHIRGKASDIETSTNYIRGKVLKGLYKAGFIRVGINFKKGFVHADINDGPESCWDYA